MHSNKESRSINQLLGVPSEEVNEESGYLVKRVQQLLDKSIDAFNIEDYRILINQNIALQYLLSPALDVLTNNIMAEGDYYEGDLLKSILTIDSSFWEKNIVLRDQFKTICHSQFDTIKALDLSSAVNESIYILVKRFL